MYCSSIRHGRVVCAYIADEIAVPVCGASPADPHLSDGHMSQLDMPISAHERSRARQTDLFETATIGCDQRSRSRTSFGTRFSKPMTRTSRLTFAAAAMIVQGRSAASSVMDQRRSTSLAIVQRDDARGMSPHGRRTKLLSTYQHPALACRAAARRLKRRRVIVVVRMLSLLAWLKRAKRKRASRE